MQCWMVPVRCAAHCMHSQPHSAMPHTHTSHVDTSPHAQIGGGITTEEWAQAAAERAKVEMQKQKELEAVAAAEAERLRKLEALQVEEKEARNLVQELRNSLGWMQVGGAMGWWRVCWCALVCLCVVEELRGLLGWMQVGRGCCGLAGAGAQAPRLLCVCHMSSYRWSQHGASSCAAQALTSDSPPTHLCPPHAQTSIQLPTTEHVPPPPATHPAGGREDQPPAAPQAQARATPAATQACGGGGEGQGGRGRLGCLGCC